MKFLPLALLSIAVVGTTESVVIDDVPTEVPSEAPMESEFPFSTTPFFVSDDSTFYPQEEDCREFPKDLDIHIMWKLNKTFGERNCQTKVLPNNSGLETECFVEERGWYRSLAVTYIAIPQTQTRHPDSVSLNDLPFAEYEPDSLNLYWRDISNNDSFSKLIDFEATCMRHLGNQLDDLEQKPVFYEDPPTMAPTMAPQISYFPNGSEFPFSTTPFYSSATLFPEDDCKVYPRDTDSYIRWKLNKTFGEENCVMTELPPSKSLKIDCYVKVEGWFQAWAEYTAIYNPAERTKKYVEEYEPIGLVLTDANDAGYSFQESIDFETLCIDHLRNYFQTIEVRRENPEDAPVLSDGPTDAPTEVPTVKEEPNCDNSEGDVKVNSKLRLTCAELVNFKPKKRARFCGMEKVASFCPGICNPVGCKCMDYPLEFKHKWKGKGKGPKFMTCEALRGQSPGKQSRRCQKNDQIRDICRNTCTC